MTIAPRAWSPSDGAAAALRSRPFLVHGEGDCSADPSASTPSSAAFLDRALLARSRRSAAACAGPSWASRRATARPSSRPPSRSRELAGPFAPTSPIVVIAAASFEQADLVFGTARTMIAEGPLAPFFECFDTEIMRRDGPGRLYRVAAAAGTNDGGRPDLRHRGRAPRVVRARERVHLVLSNGLSKRRDGARAEHQHRGRGPRQPAGAPLRPRQRIRSGEVERPRRSCSRGLRRPRSTWPTRPPSGALREANPAIEAGFLDEDRLVARAARSPAHEFARYHLNRWVTSPDHWIDPEPVGEPARPGGPPPPGTDVVLGFDGSYRRDSTALVGCTTEGYLFHVAAWERDTRRSRLDGAAHRGGRRRGRRHGPLGRSGSSPAIPPGWHAGARGLGARVAPRRSCASTPTRRPGWGRPATGSTARSSRARVSHDGDAALARHVANCRTRDTPVRPGGREVTQGQPAQDRPRRGRGHRVRARRHGTRGRGLPERLRRPRVFRRSAEVPESV